MRRRLRDWARILLACLLLAASLAAAQTQEIRHAPPPRPPISTEETYYAQPAMLGAAVAALAPARPGVPELYFLGFAGTSTEDVFLKEAHFAQSLFDARFGTRGRSLILVNNPATVKALPVASVSNLRAALEGIAQKMNRDEDILFLYLTSHGAPHVLSVRFPELALDDLHDDALKAMLDRAGIAWRVIVVSACYSGSFVDRLKDERTLVITAAAADRTSFGCGSENEFTYFGDAYLNTALKESRNFITAFDRAKQLIAAREKAEKLTPSQPQIYVGAAIKAKLAAVEKRLAAAPGGAGKH
jgi:hypothetical protein